MAPCSNLDRLAEGATYEIIPCIEEAGAGCLAAVCHGQILACNGIIPGDLQRVTSQRLFRRPGVLGTGNAVVVTARAVYNETFLRDS
jgi:hypothetical protein